MTSSYLLSVNNFLFSLLPVYLGYGDLSNLGWERDLYGGLLKRLSAFLRPGKLEHKAVIALYRRAIIGL